MTEDDLPSAEIHLFRKLEQFPVVLEQVFYLPVAAIVGPTVTDVRTDGVAAVVIPQQQSHSSRIPLLQIQDPLEPVQGHFLAFDSCQGRGSIRVFPFIWVGIKIVSQEDDLTV